MYTSHPNGDKGPEPFKTFKFYTDTAPNDPYEVFNIPSDLMFKAGVESGFKNCDFKMQYPSKEKAKDPIMQKYLKECKYSDYIMKFKN